MFAPTELYNDGKHICISFSDLVAEAGEAVQANQFLVVDNGDDALIDPGGNMTYPRSTRPCRVMCRRRSCATSPRMPTRTSLRRSRAGSAAPTASWSFQHLVARFAPHFCTGTSTEGRIMAIKDGGAILPPRQEQPA
ncbi:MAG: hypothetical protein U1F05_01305 [Burkholderiales bacterium]